jgi:ferrochelatase
VSVGVLLVNSGTPASTSNRDVRRFLAGLLGDPRVVELPRWLWLPILYGFILTTRPRQSAKKYQAIWTRAGSPLAVESEALRAGLERALELPVALGMLYGGGRSVDAALAELRHAGAERVLVLPMFPQYCGASTGAVFDQVSAALTRQRRLPDLRFVMSYHDHPAYLDVLAASVAEHWLTEGATRHLVISFHGIPERNVQNGDPYREQCLRTAELLAQRLKLAPDAWSVTFQSRFGRAKWLTPYTIELLAELPKRGVQEVSVVCPGFVADCLETLEEIGMENRDVFLAAGGKKYQYVPALNARPDHVEALREIVASETRGWMEAPAAGRGMPGEAA